MSTIYGLVTAALYADPEQRTSQAGNAYVRAALVHRGDANAVTFVRVTAFAPLAAELAALRKGDLVSVAGRLKARAYINKSNEPAAGIELVAERMVILTPGGHDEPAPPPAPLTSATPAPPPAEAGPIEGWKSDIPF